MSEAAAGRDRSGSAGASLRRAPASDPGADLGRLARGSALNLFGAGVAAAINVVFVVVAARSYTKVDLGVFFATTAVFVVAGTLARFGATTGVVYFIARLRALGRHDRILSCLRAAFWPTTVAAVVIGGLLAAWAGSLGSVVVDGDTGQAGDALVVLALFIPFSVWNDVALAATRGFGVMRALVRIDRIARPAGQMLLLVIAIVWFPDRPQLLVIAWGLPYVFAAVAAALWLRRLTVRDLARHPGASVVAVEDPESMGREFWRFTAPRGLTSMAAVVLQRLGVVLLAAVSGAGPAAIFGAATRFLVVGQLAGQALGATVQPQLSEQMARHEWAAAGSIYRTSTAWLVLISWPLYLTFSVFSGVVTQVFGGGYDEGAAVIRVLMLTMLFATATGLVDVMLEMAGKTRWTLANSLVALAANLVVNLALIPQYGVLGAAIAWAVAIVINNALPLTQLGFSLHLHPFGRATLTAMGLALACFAVVPALVLATTSHPADLAVMVVSLAISVVLYVPALVFFRRPLSLDELRAIRSRRRARGEPSVTPADPA